MSSQISHSRESYQLLTLTPSDEDEDDLGLPDLDLATPTQSTGARIKRKIRLKRKDRDRITGVNAAGSLSGAESNSSLASSGDFVSCPISSCCCSPHQGQSRSCGMTLGLLFGVGVFVILAYFTAATHIKLAEVELSLEGMKEERKDLVEKYRSLHVQMQDLLSNQTALKTNITNLEINVQSLSSQISSLNSSFESVASSLRASPSLKDLPNAIAELNTNVAKMGSRLADLEIKFKDEEDAKNRNGDAKSVSRRDLDSLDSRISEVGTSIAQQLETVEQRSAKSWEMLAALLKNVDSLTNRVDGLERG